MRLTLRPFLIVALGVSAVRAEEPTLNANPKFYQKYFNLEKGDTLIGKVRHLGDRILEAQNSQKKDKSILGIRQALKDLSSSIDTQNGHVDAGQSSMLLEVLPAERALTIVYKELRDVAETLEMGWKEISAAKAMADTISTKHVESAQIETAVTGEAARISEEIAPGSAYDRPQDAQGDSRASSWLSAVAAQRENISSAMEKLRQAHEVMEIAGDRLSEAEGKIERVLPFAEKAGEVHNGAQRSLRGNEGINASKRILADATQTARRAMGLSRKVFTVMEGIQLETRDKLLASGRTEEALEQAKDEAQEAIEGALKSDGEVREAGSEWDQAGDDDAIKAAASAKAESAKTAAMEKAAPAVPLVAEANALALAAKPTKACGCGKKSAASALGEGADQLAKIDDYKSRYQPTAQRAAFTSGKAADAMRQKKDRFKMPRIDPKALQRQ